VGVFVYREELNAEIPAAYIPLGIIQGVASQLAVGGGGIWTVGIDEASFDDALVEDFEGLDGYQLGGVRQLALLVYQARAQYEVLDIYGHGNNSSFHGTKWYVKPYYIICNGRKWVKGERGKAKGVLKAQAWKYVI